MGHHEMIHYVYSDFDVEKTGRAQFGDYTLYLL